jgi:hypothetical protein
MATTAPENAPVGSAPYGSYPPQLPLTPGSYSNASFTVGPAGKISAISSGSGIGNLAVTQVPNAASPYSVVAGDQFIAASAGVSSPTEIDLPAATGSGRVLIIKKMDANAEDIEVTPNGSDTIDGTAAAYDLATQYNAVQIVDYAAGAWAIIASY